MLCLRMRTNVTDEQALGLSDGKFVECTIYSPQFAILVPISLAPLIFSLLWAQHKAKRLLDRSQAYRPRSVHKKYATFLRDLIHSDPRSWSRQIVNACAEMDFIGLLLIAASLALFLLPLGLAPMSKQGWGNPTMVR